MPGTHMLGARGVDRASITYTDTTAEHDVSRPRPESRRKPWSFRFSKGGGLL